MNLKDTYIQSGNIIHRVGKNISMSYSDGDDTENYLLEVVEKVDDRSTSSKEWEQYIIDWPTKYHLSSQRVDLLRPFRSSLNSRKVLEIGSGCGAITRWLGESGAEVTALEGSERRAKITAARCRDLSNVKVVWENFDELITDEKFDIIFLIGVLEYSNLYIKGDDPAGILLRKVKSFLSDDGFVVIAIENKLGLKYWTGAPEDHLGIPYAGIENRYGKDSAVTYGRKELEGIMTEAGFSYKEFLYPFPDYKFSSVVLREKAFGLPLFNLSNIIVPLNDVEQGRGYTPGFLASRTWKEVINNGLVPELSNSFLVIGANHQLTPIDKDKFAFIYSSGRNTGYKKENIFVTDSNNEITVQRTKLDSESRPATASIHQHMLEEKYYPGDLLFLGFNEIVTKEGWSVMDLAEWAKPYYRLLSDLSAKQNDRSYINGKYIDLTPFNILTENGNLHHFDQEWEVKGDVPVSFVFFRGLYYSLARPRYFCAPATGTHTLAFELIQDILSKVSEENIESVTSEFIQQEHKYFSHISTGEEYYPHNFSLNILPSSKETELSLTNSLSFFPITDFGIQIFYQTAGEHFSDMRSVRKRIQLNGERQLFGINIKTDTPITKLRIDPSDRPGIINLHSFRIKDRFDRNLFEWPQDTNVAVEMNNIVSIGNGDDVSDNKLLFVSNDPMIIFSIPANSFDNTTDLHIELELSALDISQSTRLKQDMQQLLSIHDFSHSADSSVQHSKNSILQLASQLSVRAKADLDFKLKEAIEEQKIEKGIIAELENKIGIQEHEINTLKETERKFHQLTEENNTLKKHIAWYSDTYEKRSLPGIIKDRLKHFLRSIYLWILNILLGRSFVKNRYALRYMLEFARDNGIKASASAIRSSVGKHGIKAFTHLRSIARANLRNSYKKTPQPLYINQEEYSIEKMKAEIDRFRLLPLISIIVPTYNTKPELLRLAIKSVQDQVYPNWELCITDDGSTSTETKKALHSFANDKRIKIKFLSKNSGISAASNAAIELTSGDYIALFDHDDELTSDALFWFVREINLYPETDIIYSDECKKNELGELSDFFLKPDWSPELLFNMMYIGHLTIYRKKFLTEKVGTFRTEYDFSQDYDLALRATEQTNNIRHIDRVLYYWRETEGSASVGDKPYARQSNLAALRNAMIRRNIDAEIIELPVANRVRLRQNHSPLVSIIIPTDSYDNLSETIESINKNTSYASYEIVAVTNSELIATMKEQHHGHTRYHPYDKPYNFSDKCNEGARYANGEIVIFLNDDVRPITNDWIENTIEFLAVPGVGGVSPKLIYEDDSIQYAGMVSGVRNLNGTAFHGYHKDSYSYFNFAQLVRDVSILSGACLAMKRDLFLEVEGFDAVNTPSSHSDVDLSFKILGQGLRCVYTPYAVLRHIGHLSLNEYEKKEKEFKKDKSDIYLLRRWANYISTDPYFTKPMRDLLYHDSPEPIQIYPSQIKLTHRPGKDIILVCHDLTLSGAPIMLLNICKVLLRNDFFVVVFCEKDGPLRKIYQQEGVTVIIDSLVLKQHASFHKFAKNFDYILCNTAVTWPVVRQMQATVKTIWWLQEAKVLELFTGNPQFIETLKNAENLIGVSDYSLARVKKINPRYTKIYNSCFDFFDPLIHRRHVDDNDKIVFNIMGSIEERKGHDIFFDALSYLPIDVLNRIEVNVVGRTLNPDYAKMVKEKIKGMNFINFTGEVSNAESIRHLSSADVLVCPSRDDPFPVILVEAFCMAKTCIVSDNTGFAELITQGENGYVFRNEDARQLADIIKTILVNAESLEHTGMRARDTYKEFLTMEILEHRLIKYLKNIGSDQEKYGGTTLVKGYTNQGLRQSRKEIANNA